MSKKLVLFFVFMAVGGVTGLHNPLALAVDQSSEAKLSFLVGEVQVIRGGSASKGTLGQIVLDSDSVRTGPKSLCIINLKDGSQLKLDADSEIYIQKQTDVLLNRGGAFAKIEKQKGPQFKFRTKTSTMGVRGTEFFAALGKHSSKGEDVWLCVNEGVVDVASLATGKSVEVTKGLGVLVPAGKSPTPPQAYQWTKNLNWNMNPESGEVINKGSLDSAYRDLRDQNYD